MKSKLPVLLSLSLICLGLPVSAQESGSGSSPPPEASPLTGLFTPAPSQQSGQQVVPMPAAGNGDNPYRGLWTPPPQHQNGVTPNQPPPENTANQFKGLFTPPSEHQSGQKVEAAPQVQSSEFIKNQIEKNGFEPSDAHKALIKTFDPTYFDKKDGTQKEGGAEPAKKEAAKEDAGEAKDESAAKAGAKKKSKKSKAKAKDKDKAAEKKKEPLPVYNPLQEVIFLMNAGQYDQALSAVTNILKLQPNNAKAHYITAVVHVGRRDYAGAKKSYYQVIQLAPATPLAQMAVEGLRKIGAPPPVPARMPPLHLKH